MASRANHVIEGTEGQPPLKMWVGSKTITPASTYEEDEFGSFRTVKHEPVTIPDIEDEALTRAKNLQRMPFVSRNGIALMPDVHAGIGSNVGTVIATERAIIPAAVGVDIGCGMNAVRLSLKGSQLPDDLKTLRLQIERDVPTGRGVHSDNRIPKNKYSTTSMGYAEQHALEMVFGDLDRKMWPKAMSQVGTLGSGNHFIELCIDENDDVWVMLHSGSRGIGNMVGTYFINRAKEHMARYFVTLPDDDLAYLPEGTPDFDSYIAAVGWAQEYALENRKVMMEAVIAALRRHIPIDFRITQEAINCHHNYVEKENHFGRNMWVTRKGAIRARKDDLGVIPGSMGQRSYVVRGKGNVESYCSCSHGAGRVMSRTAAKKNFSLQDLIDQTQGVECRKEAEFIDEIPGAYKNIDEVMENQRDLVEVVHVLKQVLCVKGAS